MRRTPPHGLTPCFELLPYLLEVSPFASAYSTVQHYPPRASMSKQHHIPHEQSGHADATPLTRPHSPQDASTLRETLRGVEKYALDVQLLHLLWDPREACAAQWPHTVHANHTLSDLCHALRMEELPPLYRLIKRERSKGRPVMQKRCPHRLPFSPSHHSNPDPIPPKPYCASQRQLASLEALSSPHRLFPNHSRTPLMLGWSSSSLAEQDGSTGRKSSAP